MTGGPPAPATVVITTKNRRDDLRTALKSIVEQTVPVEVIVIDDASTDDTSDMVRREFPDVRLVTAETSLGVVVQRNHGAELATAPIIFSIDDDASFSSPTIVARTLSEFEHERHAARIGAVAIPFIDVKIGPQVRQRAPSEESVFVAGAFIGTAYAIRREVFLELDGYRGDIFHQGEERDFCIRLLDAGYVVRCGGADPVHHHVSPTRDHTRMNVYGRRNDVVHAWRNVPMPYMPVHLLATTINGIRLGLRTASLGQMLRGLMRGFRDCLSQRRRPVRATTYRLTRRLKKAGVLPLSEVESLLPPPSGSP